ncbi:hypothetical protein ACB098_07G065300 [Castanea mollissima]
MGSITGATATRPHVVCVPVPLQGHITPMLKLAKLLHHKGFHVTFVHTEYNCKRLLRSRGPNSLDGLADFHFEAIPDGLPPSDADNCLVPFCNLLYKLNDTSSSNVPPVTCIISDGCMSFTLDAADKFGIPDVQFWTPSSCGFLSYMHFRHLVERGLIPLKDASYLTNGYLETKIDWIQGMKNIRLKDLPNFIKTTDENDIVLKFVLHETERTLRASAIILNTFDSFEQDVLDALSSMLPRIYTIGPLSLLADQIEDDNLKSINSNLWKEEPGCLEWLNSKEPNSVVYVNFGSKTVITPQQLIEFAWGLANSDIAIVPPEFFTRTKNRGMLANWCPQEQILKHPSIGGFLTHNGWNSILESVCNGVPMISWPFFAEQQINSLYCCTVWGIGMEIDNNVQRDEVENLVRELMDGKKGSEMKKKVLEWKTKAEVATRPGGTSYQNLDKLIAEVLLARNV